MLRIEPGASGCEVHMLPLCYAPPSRHLTFCHHDKKSLRSKEKISPTPNAYQIQNQQSPGLIKILGFTPPDFENGILTLAERQEMKRGNKQRIGPEALIRNNSICFCQKFGTAADNRRYEFRRKTFVGRRRRRRRRQGIKAKLRSGKKVFRLGGASLSKTSVSVILGFAVEGCSI